MKLSTWIKSRASERGVPQRVLREELATSSGIRSHTVWLIASNGKRCSSALASRLSAATGGEVTVAELLYPDGLPAGAVMAPPTNLDPVQDPGGDCALAAGELLPAA